MKNKLFLALLLITLSVSAFGKDRCDSLVLVLINKCDSSVLDTIPYHRFNSHWDIGAAVGLNAYFGEINTVEKNFWKRITPSLEISAERSITPVVSFRGLASIGTVNGWNTAATSARPGYYDDDNLHFAKFNMTTLQLHALFNLSNAICGYDENRRFSIISFLGTGMAHPWGNGQNNREIIFPVGILTKVYLTSKLDLTVELRHIFTNPRMDNVLTPGKFYEGMGTLSVGLSYKFGDRDSKKSVKPVSVHDSNRVTNRDLFMNN